jgi:hypothetical protein
VGNIVGNAQRKCGDVSGHQKPHPREPSERRLQPDIETENEKYRLVFCLDNRLHDDGQRGFTGQVSMKPRLMAIIPLQCVSQSFQVAVEDTFAKAASLDRASLLPDQSTCCVQTV